MKNSNTTEVLKELESLYIKKDYTKAIDLMLKNSSEFDKGLYHFNLGTIYTKLKNFPVARFHFEKSTVYGFSGQELRNNLEIAKSGIQSIELEQSDNIIDSIYAKSIYTAVDYFYLASLILLLISVLLLVKKKISNLIFGLFCLLLTIPVGYKLFVNDQVQVAILLKETKTKEGPSSVFQDTHEIPGGLKVIIDRPKDGWYLIRYPEHLSGWIKKEELGII